MTAERATADRRDGDPRADGRHVSPGSTPARDRPVIGLSAPVAHAAWGVWNADAVLLSRAYVDAVAAAGGVPVILPPVPGLVEAL